MDNFIGILNYPTTGSQEVIADHSKLSNLDYDSSGHTNFAKSPDNRLLTTSKELYGAINELFSKTNIKPLPYELDGGNALSIASKMIILDGGTHNTIYGKDREINGGDIV